MFKTLSSALALVLVAGGLVACNGAATGSTRGDDILLLSGDSDAGADVFAQHCASCHGADATGGGGPSLIGNGKDYAELIDIVLNGKEEMPAQGGALSDTEVADVVEYVHGL